jgi:alpha-galactosidase
VITTGPPSDTHGEAFGFSLVYSGNFLFEAEINDMNRLRVNMGIHPMCMQWHLQQGTPQNILQLFPEDYYVSYYVHYFIIIYALYHYRSRVQHARGYLGPLRRRGGRH